MIPAALALLLLLQDARDPDPAPLSPPEADAAFRSDRLARAEEILRAEIKLKAEAGLHVSLGRVLERARKFPELKAEGQHLVRSASDSDLRALGHAWMALAAWRTGDRESAAKSCDEAIASADQKAPNAARPARQLVRRVRGLLPYLRRETATHVVWLAPDSPLQVRWDELSLRLDAITVSAREALGVAGGPKLEAFVYTDQAQADLVIDSPVPAAWPRERAYHVLHDGSFGHLAAQVVGWEAAAARGVEPPRAGLLALGFAAAHAGDGAWDRRIREITSDLASRGALPALAELAAQPGGGSDVAAVSGHFVRWLVATRGGPAFARLWTSQARDPWTEIYGAPLGDLETAWRSSIK